MINNDPSMNKFWTEVFNFCETTTQSVSEYLLINAGHLQATRKDDGSLITQADRWSDQTIRDAITTKFPDHGIITEETEHILPHKDWCWVVDPIDGTTNFTRGVPIWGISLGLLYQGMPVFGYVHFPPVQQTFHGYWYNDTGLTGPQGAFLNKKPIQTSKDQPSQNHLFNLCARSTEVLNKPFPCKIRMIGVASYNILMVACGASLGGVEATSKLWDLAGAIPILKAAGGDYLTLESEPVFPLTMGENYGERPFPSLFVSRTELIDIFNPLVSFIGEKVKLSLIK